MDDFWKGIFVPLRKHVREIELIELDEMDDAEVPKGRVRTNAERVLPKSQVMGYFRVTFNMHNTPEEQRGRNPHGGKEVYYYPADEAQVEEARQGNFPPAEEFYSW